MSGIYIHIPFCKQACSYCDFYFVTRAGQQQAFTDRLVQEIRQFDGSRFVREPVQTLYIGGGTPSLLEPASISRIMQALEEVFELQLEEATLEMNPDDVSAEYLQELRQLGIDRASMGVQSFNPDLLKFMNRAHTREHALHCLELLKQAGFRTFTADLIYGNPGQTLKALDNDLDTLLSFEPPHVSAYSLTIEPRTRLGKQVDLGRLTPPSDEQVADHYDRVVGRLQEAGMCQYEVSNFSREGAEAIHNSAYWTHENYLGFGPAAHSFWWSEDREHASRWSNARDLKMYLDKSFPGLSREEREQLSLNQLAEERLMMSLRTRRGVNIRELEQRYGYPLNERQYQYLRQLEKQGKAELNDRVRLQHEGLRIADSIVLDLVTMGEGEK